jgi:phosphatidyl-myo-inositol dimannoside synthase
VLASREQVDPRTGLRDVETMGRVLCEAHAAGVPVVASRSGGIPSIVDHGRNGLLFEENDLDGLIHGIERLR